MNFKIKILSFSVFVAGLCSIVYELLISATATYFLGDGVRQFSILIGVYLFSMGIGAYCSKFFKERPLEFFIKIEYILGLIGGVSVPLLYYLFVSVSPMTLQILCLAIMFCIGLLTGMEVPLLTFVNEDDDYKDNLSNVLSLDYIGGLIATLIFPFILLPFVGLFYSSLIFGIANILLGLWINFMLVKKWNKVTFFGIFSLLILVVMVFFTAQFLKVWDEKIYKNPVVENIQTPFQKIVITKKQEDVRLFLNRSIQFSSLDEHRYHELLVHVPMTIHPNPKTVLILGGGENLASREVLKHLNVRAIDVVDIDSTIFHLSKHNKMLLDINKGASINPKVNLIVDDAFIFLKNNFKQYDVIISDLPDPSNDAIARLYSKQFFMLIKKNLDENGIFVTQSGEIYYSNQAFSCIKNTVNEVFEFTKTYQTYVPSFGNWGFTIAANSDFDEKTHSTLPNELKYLTDREYANSFVMPKDISIIKTKINTIDHPVILNYFLDDWSKWKIDMLTN
ncbi:spermidine synthase [Flavobacterium arsenatis]|uniref:Polyamine aminopropyltransferase n=1 Tax=Flavobacterium arsenatis TaxID=1484332 RepID=A0ABU1TMA7_9FLAO|nr:polyamine aminopropyltransferase [Flavobacterium arsenatis]MDR6967094.1 spermidine synthase [Flavobacterium arsenatis]